MGAKKLERSASEVCLEQALREGRATKQELAIRHIVADPELQSRVEMDGNHVKHLAGLMDMGVDLRPVVVFFDGKTYRLADGFHRLKAHKSKAGVKDIWAYVLVGSKRDAILYSVSANLENSKPTSREDRVKAVRMMLADPECFTWSNAEIARRCGISHSHVKRVRATWCTEKGVPLPELVKCFMDGRHYKDNPYNGSYGSKVPMVRTYRNSNGRGKPGLYATVDGKQQYLGVDAFKAKAAIKGILAKSRAKSRSCARRLFENACLVDWLQHNGIAAAVTGRPGQISVVRAPGVLCALVKDDSHDGFLGAIARLFLVAKGDEEGSRLIAVLQCDVLSTRLGWLARLASSKPFPVELMTPEELVAAVGPKGEAEPTPDPR